MLEAVTLILGMSKADGIYMSTDYRVTNSRTGKIIDDDAIKFLRVDYPPQGGPRALFGFAGVAILPDGTPTGDWIRETLRGDMHEGFDQSMAHFRARLNRDIARMRALLMVNVLVISGEKRYCGGMSNLGRRNGKLFLRNSFGYTLEELQAPYGFATGSGANSVMQRKHVSLLKSQLDVWPRRTMDHLKLLATVNRRIAAKDASVSPFCHVTFVNANARVSPVSRAFVEHGESVPIDSPSVIVHGVDLTPLLRRMRVTAAARFRGEDQDFGWDKAEINKEMERRR